MLAGLLYAFASPFVWPGDTADVHRALTRPAWILSFFALVPLLWAVRNMTPFRAYLFSAWMAVPGTFIVLHWLMIAMHVFGGISNPVSAALVLLLSCAGWTFMAMAVGVARWMEVHWAWPTWLTVPLSCVGMEMSRARIYFGGFPWGNLGSTTFNNLTLLQFGSVAGVYGTLAVLCLVNVALFEVIRWLRKERAAPTRLVATNVVLLALVCVFGQYRIAVVDEEARTAQKVRVGLLQGNIEQGIKNKDWQHRGFIVDRYAALQRDALAQGAQLIVWPEVAYPIPMRKDVDTAFPQGFPPLAPAVGIIGASVYWHDTPTLTGEACQVARPPPGCRGRALTHNSAVLAAPDLSIVGRFDKSHLVPFGEYVPWPLGPIAKAVVPMLGQTVPGEQWKPITYAIGNVPVQLGALVCYEGIFPQHTGDFVSGGAELLINITNDAWYGVSSASVQHMAFYTLRAAEHGRAVARAANTGITLGIDPVGRLLSPTELYETTAVMVDLPVMKSRTLYTMTGDAFGWLCWAPWAWALYRGVSGWYLTRRAARRAAKAG